MKRILVLTMSVLLVLSVFAGCAPAADAPAAEEPVAEEPAAEEPVEEEPVVEEPVEEEPLAEEPVEEEPAEEPVEEEPAEEPADADDSAEIPEGVKDGIKVAVIRNLNPGDHTEQFLTGCTDEGNAFGFEVDTFVTNGEDQKLQDTAAQVIEQDYDGIIISHGKLEYSYDMLLPAREKGIVVSTFDTMPYKDGDEDNELLEGVTSTAQNDQKLAELSLNDMVDFVHEKKGDDSEPVKVLKTFMGPGVPPLDRRNEIYNEMESDGIIETVEIIQPSDVTNARGDMNTKTAAVLPRYQEGDIDACWGCYDELAKGVMQAMNDLGRTDFYMFSIDVSDEDIQMMVENEDIWLSTAAVDPKLIGIANMRLVALKLAGEDTPEYYNLDAQLIKTDQLSADTTMDQLADVVEGWGTIDSISDLERPWMEALRAEHGS